MKSAVTYFRKKPFHHCLKVSLMRFNRFVADAPFLYPQKRGFQAMEKGSIENKWVNSPKYALPIRYVSLNRVYIV